MKTLQTKIHTYRFDLDKPADVQAYEELRQRLSDGRHFFNVLAIPGKEEHKVNAGEITLETAFIFSDQWNSAEQGRVFDWYEGIYPNKRIKAGHYLDITEEMRQVRRDTLKCGYCGKHCQAADNPGEFCSACLDSEYLKETDLHLLRLCPAGEWNPARPELTAEERATLLPLYVSRQTTGNHSRAVQKKARIRQSVIDKYVRNQKTNETEYRGFLWLLDHGVNTENCIYYSHTDKFSFGWRQPVSAAIKSALLDVLTEFPYTYEIKAEKEVSTRA